MLISLATIKWSLKWMCEVGKEFLNTISINFMVQQAKLGDHQVRSYKNDQHDASVSDNLLLHCSLTAQCVSSIIIAHHQELLNCNYSFWFYSCLSFHSHDSNRQRQA
jgi:hypothetical protein